MDVGKFSNGSFSILFALAEILIKNLLFQRETLDAWVLSIVEFIHARKLKTNIKSTTSVINLQRSDKNLYSKL